MTAIPITRTNPTRDECRAIIQDLIEWSRRQPGLTFAPRANDREQAFVTFSFPNGATFWQAYPHADDGARLYVTGSKLLPESVRVRLRDRFAALSTPHGPKTGVHPTISFGDLVPAENRRAVLELLGEALASVAAE